MGKNRLPPYELNAEESVLGSLLIDSDSMLSVSQLLDPSDFFSEQNQLLFRACKQLFGRGEAIDQITVARELIDMGKLDDAGGAAYLSYLIAHVPTSIHIEYYGRIVKRLAIRRRIISMGGQISELGFEEPDVDKSMQTVGQMVLDVQKTLAVPQLITPKEMATLAMQHYSDASSGKRVAISTGIEELDILCGGMFPGEYWILSAATGLGKTKLAVDTIAARLCKHFKVLYVGLEMTPMQIMDRRVASVTQRSMSTIRRGNYSDELGKEVYNAVGEFAEQNLYFYSLGTGTNPQNITTDSVYAVSSYMKLSYGLDLVIIDYIGLLDDNFGSSSYERVSYISRKLKLMAITLGVPFLVICQLNREIFMRKDPRPQLSDLRDSGRIEQDADVVMFLHRDSFFRDDADPNKAELIVRKARQGDEQNFKVDLTWDDKRKQYV